jgi:hypothetical protein
MGWSASPAAFFAGAFNLAADVTPFAAIGFKERRLAAKARATAASQRQSCWVLMMFAVSDFDLDGYAATRWDAF